MFTLDLGHSAFLHRIETRHAGALYRLLEQHREGIARWHSWAGELDSLEAFSAWLKRLRLEEAEDHRLTCSMWFRSELAGLVGLSRISGQHRCAELWGFVVPTDEGPSLTERAHRALIEHGLQDLNLERISFHCAKEDHHSRRLAGRLGLRHEGLLRSFRIIGGRYLDYVVYSALRGEWQMICELNDNVPVRPARPDDTSWIDTSIGPLEGPLSGENCLTWVVEQQGLLKVSRASEDTARVETFAIAPEVAGQQVGRRLLEVAAAELCRIGTRLLLLYVDPAASEHHLALLREQQFSPATEGLWIKGL